MSFIRTIQINAGTKVGIWEISEPEQYFLQHVSLQRTVSHPYKRLQHLAGRRLLKKLAPDFPVEDILISPSGKPYLPGSKFNFSISHSENYAAAIISRNERVGIDVEKISPKLSRIASKFLNKEEQAFVGPNLIWYALGWSAKEAVYKWYGRRGIDFKKHIHLQAFYPEKEGIIPCVFNKEEEIKLDLHYRVGREFVLVWVAEGAVGLYGRSGQLA